MRPKAASRSTVQNSCRWRYRPVGDDQGSGHAVVGRGRDRGAVDIVEKADAIIERGIDPRYLPTGHLVYGSTDGMLGIAFDADRLTTAGGPVPLVQGCTVVEGCRVPTRDFRRGDAGVRAGERGSQLARLGESSRRL